MELSTRDWHCVAHEYDGAAIRAYVNGSAITNLQARPFAYTGGIYRPEAWGKQRAEFPLGVTRSTGVNQFVGLLAGLARHAAHAGAGGGGVPERI